MDRKQESASRVSDWGRALNGKENLGVRKKNIQPRGRDIWKAGKANTRPRKCALGRKARKEKTSFTGSSSEDVEKDQLILVWEDYAEAP